MKLIIFITLLIPYLYGINTLPDDVRNPFVFITVSILGFALVSVKGNELIQQNKDVAMQKKMNAMQDTLDLLGDDLNNAREALYYEINSRCKE